MDDRTLLAVCIADEAGNQPHEGKVAVGVVVMNRTRLRYESDGTISGTILRPNQFSGFYFAMMDGHYTRVASTVQQASQRADQKLATYSHSPGLWKDCLIAADQAMGVQIFDNGGPEFKKLTPDTVLYYNPAIVSHAPFWATPDKLVATIYDHTFYRA